MHDAKTWTIELFLDEEDGHTRARAELRGRDAHLTGHGLARCRPGDADVPEIGDELAVARALADLSHQLIDASIVDIGAAGHRTESISA